ncbi:MAG: hypothetical protein IPL40_05610 [Proteobacteria bacterium]|nr:hypothetical protein [Pseudomonadota bacterium]
MRREADGGAIGGLLRSRTPALLALTLALAALAGARNAAATAEGGAIAVIVHPDNPLTRISLTELRAILLRQKDRWPNGNPIRILNWEANSATRVAVDQAVLKMSPERVAAYWVDRRIRGLGTPPRSINSAQLIEGIVERNTDFISYLPAHQAGARVKTLIIDGKQPGETLYPIKAQAQ